MSKLSVKGVWQVLKDAGAGFGKHKVFKLSASLAYYTIFSIGPTLLVAIFFADLFWGRQAIDGTIYKQMSGWVGKETALQIQSIIKNASVSGNNFTSIIGFVTLIIAATTVYRNAGFNQHDLEFESKSRQWVVAYFKKQASLFFCYSKPGFPFARITFNKYVAGWVYE